MSDDFTLDAPELLLGDSSVLFVIFDAGADCAARVLDHFGDRLHVVHDVWVEIDNHKADTQPETRSEGIAEFLSRFPIERARQLPYEVQSKARSRLRLAAKWEPHKHADEDMGETATCYYADYVWDDEQFVVLVGDKWGKSLAVEFELPFFKTNDVVIYLVCNKVVTLVEAEGMWLKLSAGPVENLHHHVEKQCPGIVGAPSHPLLPSSRRGYWSAR